MLQVPLFVNPGERIKVDTRYGRVHHPGLSAADAVAPTSPPATRHDERRALPLPLRGGAQGQPPVDGRRRPGRRPRPVHRDAGRRPSRPTGRRSTRLIDDAAIGWELERMAVVDRNVLRLAVAELLDRPDAPGGGDPRRGGGAGQRLLHRRVGPVRQRRTGHAGHRHPGLTGTRDWPASGAGRHPGLAGIRGWPASGAGRNPGLTGIRGWPEPGAGRNPHPTVATVIGPPPPTRPEPR